MWLNIHVSENQLIFEIKIMNCEDEVTVYINKEKASLIPPLTLILLLCIPRLLSFHLHIFLSPQPPWWHHRPAGWAELRGRDDRSEGASGQTGEGRLRHPVRTEVGRIRWCGQSKRPRGEEAVDNYYTVQIGNVKNLMWPIIAVDNLMHVSSCLSLSRLPNTTIKILSVYLDLLNLGKKSEWKFKKLPSINV